MPQTKTEIRHILETIAAAPRHQLGQNFMIDGNLVRAVAAAGELTPADAVIEIGPGTGTLTGEILASAGRVLAVEIDRKIAEFLVAQHAQEPRLRILHADALAGKHKLHGEILAWIAESRAAGAPIKVVSNLPYAAASPLVVELLIAGVDLLAVTVQKEVAHRLRAAADAEDFGPLSVTVQLLADVEILRTLPPEAFWPMPKIDSALVRMRRRDRLGPDAPAFGRFVQSVFSSRRKTMKKAMELAGIEAADATLARAGIDPQTRPQNVPVEGWLNLYRAAAIPSRAGAPERCPERS